MMFHIGFLTQGFRVHHDGSAKMRYNALTIDEEIGDKNNSAVSEVVDYQEFPKFDSTSGAGNFVRR